MTERLKAMILYIVEAFYSFLNAGVSADSSKNDLMRIRSFNILTLVGISIIIVHLIFLVSGTDVHNRLQFILCNLLPFLFCILLHGIMRMGKPFVSYLLAFTVFPLIIFLMTIYFEDRAVPYFQLVLIICVFYFFDSYKLIIPVSLLALGYFAYGTHKLLQSNVQIYQHNEQQYTEVVTYVCAVLFFYFVMFFLSGRVKSIQNSISGQKFELKKMNAVLQQKSKQLEDRNIVLNKVFSIVSHDLRVPVEGLKLMMKAAKSEKELMEAMHEIMPDFKKEVIKMSALFENLISWAKLELNENLFVLKDVNINLVVNEVHNILKIPAANKSVSIKKEITRDLKFRADNDMLEIVLRNLVANAIKFTNIGGTVSIKAYKTDAAFYLQVCDTGIGMDTKTLNAIMENSFYTTCGTQKEIGTGLGLMICQDIVAKLNGTMHIKSTKGEGTCVSALFPVSTNEAVPALADTMPCFFNPYKNHLKTA